jgi:hypothetical protein
VDAATIMKEASKPMERALAAAKFSKEIYRKAAEAFVEEYRDSSGKAEAYRVIGLGWRRTTSVLTAAP